MIKAIIALLLFGACHITTSLAALLWLNWENLVNEQPLDASLLLSQPATSGIALLIGSILTIGILLLTKISRKSALSALIRRPEKSYFTAYCSVLSLALGLSFIFSPLDLADNGTTALFNAMKGNVWCLILLCLVGPLLEEFVFREGILRHLARKAMPPLAAAIVSALLFGMVHGNMAQMIPAALLGFVFGLFYIRTGDIQLSAYAHILNNTLGVLLMFYPQVEEWSNALSLPVAMSIGGILLLTGCVLLGVWWKKTSSNAGKNIFKEERI